MHKYFPDECHNVGRNRATHHCKPWFPFKTPRHTQELDEAGARMLYKRGEKEGEWVVPHNRALLVRPQCHNNVQRITSLGWEVYLTKYFCKAAGALPVPVNLASDAFDVEKLLKLRSLERMENGMMLLGIHQRRANHEVHWIPTDPWSKLGHLKRKKRRPQESRSTDVVYLNEYELYLRRPKEMADAKNPDYYRFYRKRQSAAERDALEGNPAKPLHKTTCALMKRGWMRTMGVFIPLLGSFLRFRA